MYVFCLTAVQVIQVGNCAHYLNYFCVHAVFKITMGICQSKTKLNVVFYFKRCVSLSHVNIYEFGLRLVENDNLITSIVCIDFISHHESRNT